MRARDAGPLAAGTAQGLPALRFFKIERSFEEGSDGSSRQGEEVLIEQPANGLPGEWKGYCDGFAQAKKEAQAALEAEQYRHDLTLGKWMNERKELTDELVKTRAERDRWIEAFSKAVGVGVPIPEVLDKMSKDRDKWRDYAQKELDRANALAKERDEAVKHRAVAYQAADNWEKCAKEIIADVEIIKAAAVSRALANPEKHWFTCPDCGGHYFGTSELTGKTIRSCHDQNGTGCRWSGEYPD